MSLADIRRDYVGPPLGETESHPDPFRQFAIWFEEARAREVDPTAMSLATVAADGRPSVRMVLLKGVDERGFVFYTNFASRKAHDLAANPQASLLFFWGSLQRQVRVSGPAEKVSDAEADVYFASRPIESRWSAYASRQSDVIQSREALESRYDVARTTYGDQIPRPHWWGGYRVLPEEFEFWQGRPSRLHDRLRYTRQGDAWLRERLAP